MAESQQITANTWDKILKVRYDSNKITLNNYIKNWATEQLLLDQANILDGNILSNPSNYIDNLTDLFIKN
mgnify:CR=1 FL=1